MIKISSCGLFSRHTVVLVPFLTVSFNFSPWLTIFIFDGDGNILMNMGSLVTIGSLSPKNLVHIVFDNEVHESTGSQPTNSKNVSLEKIASNLNYKVYKITSESEIFLVSNIFLFLTK